MARYALQLQLQDAQQYSSLNTQAHLTHTTRLTSGGDGSSKQPCLVVMVYGGTVPTTCTALIHAPTHIFLP